jgi:uncharacterized membrane protein
MFGLTSLGTLHTAIALVAVISAIIALYRYKTIDPDTALGRTYFWATVVTCISGFGIFQHGGFGPPHALGVLTLVVLAVATLADKTQTFGRFGRYVVTLGYSFSFFLHSIPGTTETFTRLPVGAPLFSGPDDPALKATVGVFFLIFLLGAALQTRRLMLHRNRPGQLVGSA